MEIELQLPRSDTTRSVICPFFFSAFDEWVIFDGGEHDCGGIFGALNNCPTERLNASPKLLIRDISSIGPRLFPPTPPAPPPKRLPCSIAPMLILFERRNIGPGADDDNGEQNGSFELQLLNVRLRPDDCSFDRLPLKRLSIGEYGGDVDETVDEPSELTDIERPKPKRD
ncbi:hypothetical protein BLOT_010107 [Blomia tropicalis]|nr:hypothetical protein BLOT_010107 [Blomia tropicalis]